MFYYSENYKNAIKSGVPVGFDLLFSKTVLLLFLRLPERKILDPNGPDIT